MASRIGPAQVPTKAFKLWENEGWCLICEQFLPIDKFPPDSAGIRPRKGACEDCREIDEPGAITKKKKKRQTIQSANQRNRDLWLRYASEAGGKCHKCGYSGYNGSVAALQFHHINPAEKEYTPAYLISGCARHRVIKELSKCILLCANCHFEHKAGLWRCEYVRFDGLGWAIKKGSLINTTYDELNNLPEKYRYTQLGTEL